jgi:hypothetical protein
MTSGKTVGANAAIVSRKDFIDNPSCDPGKGVIVS